MRMAALASSLLLATTAVSASAIAATDPTSGQPDATVLISEKAADIGVGATWGGGTLHYHGRSYHFTIKGIDVAAVGYSQIVGHGRVYEMKDLHSFNGTYAAVDGEATADSGRGGQVLKNGNGDGVLIKIDDLTKGARLAGAAQGVTLQLSGVK